MSTVSTRLIHIERTRTCVRLRLGRPEHYNALDSLTLHSLQAFLTRRMEALPLVLEGDPEFFSVGADITELARLDSQQASAYSRLGHEVVQALESWPGVTIAHVSGYALGAGLELLLGCDVLVGSHNARMGLPGLAWALVPCMGGLRRLACRVSESFSADLFLCGDMLDAEQALESGLLDRLVHHDLEVTALAAEMADYSAQAVQAIRSLRLERQGLIDTRVGSAMFSRPFANGECQKRLKQLLAS
jgi:enoyl-CoA hydratase/carnithine racemase